MTSIFGREEGPRYPRGQKFRLSQKGAEAEAGYRAAISASRDQEGRASFDSARAAWAKPLSIQPEDGLYLAELVERPRSISELVEALDDCGATKSNVKAGIDRLVAAGLLEAVG